MLTIVTAWWAKQTQESWTFYIVVASFAILVGGLIWTGIRRIHHYTLFKHPIVLSYLIPKKKYPAATFVDAQDDEIKPDKLTIGIGMYKVLHRLTPKVDILVNAMVLRFEGPEENKPQCHGSDNPYSDNPYIVELIEKVNGKYYKDWWGDIQPITSGYPRYIHSGDTLAIGNRVETKGIWQGIF